MTNNPCTIALALALVKTSTEFWAAARKMGHSAEEHLQFLRERTQGGAALVKRADTPWVLPEDPGLPEGYLDSLMEISPVVRKAEPCSRCGGGGIYRWNGPNGGLREGTCFRCGGSGKDPHPSRSARGAAKPRMTPEEVESLLLEKGSKAISTIIAGGWTVKANENVGGGAMESCDPGAYEDPDCWTISPEKGRVTLHFI